MDVTGSVFGAGDFRRRDAVVEPARCGRRIVNVDNDMARAECAPLHLVEFIYRYSVVARAAGRAHPLDGQHLSYVDRARLDYDLYSFCGART